MKEVKVQRNKTLIDQPIRINMNPQIGQENRVRTDVIHLIVHMTNFNSRVVTKSTQTDPRIHSIWTVTEVTESTTKQELD